MGAESGSHGRGAKRRRGEAPKETEEGAGEVGGKRTRGRGPGLLSKESTTRRRRRKWATGWSLMAIVTNIKAEYNCTREMSCGNELRKRVAPSNRGFIEVALEWMEEFYRFARQLSI